MKKTILTAVVLAGVLSTYAQTNSNNESVNNAAANKNSIIIDGKKFPMTAAEYEAQRNVNAKQANMQKPVNNFSPNGNLVPLNPGTARPAVTPVDNNINKPDRQPGTNAVNTNVNAAKTNVSTEKAVVVPSPAIQMVPAGALNNNVGSQKQVTVPPVSVAVKATDVNNVSPSGLFPVTGITITSGSAPSQDKAIPVSDNKVQQVSGQPKPAEVVVTPPSVINASKAPVKQN